ncbi:cytochrome P450 [Streptomyces sp. DSM 44917]|uniref:Cytochrome P450 n=1 Tax=Streptomyces boetiae TaxID=3075541 RepID=A0ABU2LBI9_9ACTN|nr:cytochrome P450 [Streptomyces sp. DSM 44917]MDT0308846.1 cytochrome P450 [Streptomyces sp. DSM 44917]
MFADLPSLVETGHVISETLRLRPPGWLLTRVTTAEAELAGVRLPAGTTVASRWEPRPLDGRALRPPPANVPRPRRLRIRVSARRGA